MRAPLGHGLPEGPQRVSTAPLRLSNTPLRCKMGRMPRRTAAVPRVTTSNHRSVVKGGAHASCVTAMQLLATNQGSRCARCHFSVTTGECRSIPPNCSTALSQMHVSVVRFACSSTAAPIRHVTATISVLHLCVVRCAAFAAMVSTSPTLPVHVSNAQVRVDLLPTL